MKLIMMKNLILACLSAFVLDACSITHAPPQTAFDLGNGIPNIAHSDLPPILVAEPTVPAWLDNIDMTYRLHYANDQQLHPYANSRWSAPPLQLFSQRLKAGIAAAGGQVLSSTETAGNVPLVLHVDAEDFTQIFDRADHSAGRLALRLSLFNGRMLVGQTTIVKLVDAPGTDAAAGARALAGASDAAIGDTVKWLVSLGLNR